MEREDFDAAMNCLESPDIGSRSPELEGRRIVPVQGGWKVTNYEKYRKYSYSDSPEAERKRTYREEKGQNGTCPKSTKSVPGHSASASASMEEGTYSTNSRVILHFLNETTGSHFRESESSLAPINARLKEKDVTLEGVKQMIARQHSLWKGTKFEEYLRPSTLFGKEKFNQYYAAKDQPIRTNETNPRGNRPRVDGNFGTANEAAIGDY